MHNVCRSRREGGGVVSGHIICSVPPVASFREIEIGSVKAILPRVVNFKVWIHDLILQGFVGYLLIQFRSD